MDNSELTKECKMCGLRLNESAGCTHTNCPNNQGFTMNELDRFKTIGGANGRICKKCGKVEVNCKCKLSVTMDTAEEVREQIKEQMRGSSVFVDKEIYVPFNEAIIHANAFVAKLKRIGKEQYAQSHTNEVLDTLEERVKIRKADAKDSIHSDTEKFKERVNSCSWFINQIQKLR